MRRRALCAASKLSGGDSIFSINLIEGDNGEIGVKLFEYIIENADDVFSDYTFNENEDVYVSGVRIWRAIIVHDDMIALESDEFPGNILVVYLLNTGVLIIIYD